MGPRILESNDLKAISNYIKSGECKNIALMLGAEILMKGVSTSAGIPDFRSPGTGLYANLAKLKLPYPEAVFEVNFFRKNPVPFYTLAHELYPGKFRPTLTHAFIRLLSEHSLLSMCFTQNIDTLERRAGVPYDKIIEAHGSFATQRCIKCHTPFDDDKIKEMVVNFADRKVVPRCEKKGCKGLVKPDIVFFGESLPQSFSKAPSIIRSADLLIVIGTSLTVYPFASLATICPDSCPRVLINIDLVGDIGSRPDDVVLLGKCDEVIRELCEELGWEKELMKLWEETAGSTDNSAADAGPTTVTLPGSKPNRMEDEKLEEEVAKLAEKIRKEMELEEGKNVTTATKGPAEPPIEKISTDETTTSVAQSQPAAPSTQEVSAIAAESISSASTTVLSKARDNKEQQSINEAQEGQSEGKP
ncbi:Sir2 family histone deacetylase Hst2 [Lentinula boryana]|uniref:NAD-dependent protein deacetylase n=1 Tax=Lentinula boryana TaxID=40481 RepID=A0ABQ8Q5L3_9AGAR|nr:Sir2 family histone deacetylase Hst2 [Lentinula boryana]